VDKKPFAVIIDLESTGTDVNVDALLEIGAIAVDEELNILNEFSAVINVTQEQLLRGTWDGFWKMHGLNGLITEALSADSYDKATIDAGFARWLKTLGYEGRDVVLAGNSIGQFDIPMIRAQLPLTASMLHHRAIDISAQARELERVVGFQRSSREMPHRGHDDCKLELEEWRDQGVFLRGLRDGARPAVVPPAPSWGHALESY
jgi:oligoribonuclease (3'-5' exoribonuclease)